MTDRQFPPDVIRAVVLSTILWTAGNALTTGGFVTYFGRDLGANAFLISVLLVVPEIGGCLAVAARPVICWVGNRKTVWLGMSLVARLVSLGIPLMAFPAARPSQQAGLWMLAAFLAVSQAAQAFSFVAYLSWMADLIRPDERGRFFAIRSVSTLLVLLVVPVTAGYLRDWWRTEVQAGSLALETAHLAYVITFFCGVVLLLCSLLPLLKLPHPEMPAIFWRRTTWRTFQHAWAAPGMKWLLAYSWWNAFWSGLTQAAFFGYRIGPLGIGLGTYYLLESLTRLVQIPASTLSGFWCDRYGNKWPLVFGTLIVASSMLFWLAASPEQWWWIVGASVFWGAWAPINIAGPNLMLKLAPSGDNSTEIALFERVAGLLAGISGLIGGLWLTQLDNQEFAVDFFGYHMERFQLVFLVSMCGRILSLGWLWPLQEPGIKCPGEAWRILRRYGRFRLSRLFAR